MTVKESETCVNGIDLNVLQKTVSAIASSPELGQCCFRASNCWVDANHNLSTISSFWGAGQENVHENAFELHADEPPVLAGKDQAANPAEYLLHALAGCVTTSLVAHAAVNGIHIEEMESQLEGDIDLQGFLGLKENVPKGFSHIRVKCRVKSDEHNMDRLRELVEYSPIYNTIAGSTKVDIEIESK